MNRGNNSPRSDYGTTVRVLVGHQGVLGDRQFVLYMKVEFGLGVFVSVTEVGTSNASVYGNSTHWRSV